MIKPSKVTFKDIFNVNLKYLDYLLEKSYLSNRYFNNIKLSGDDVENEFRKIISNIIPKRYKVTHGYIASGSSQEIEPLITPQIDLIIVDTLVPHSIFILDRETGMELVPIEAVVGIFEIKRKLNPKVFAEALKQLFEIQKSIKLDKTNKRTYFPAGINALGIYHSNPILGILSLDDKKYKTEKEYATKYGEIVDEFYKGDCMPALDICASLGNFIMYTSAAENIDKLEIVTVREMGKKYFYTFKIRLDEKLSKAYFLSVTLGFILLYLSRITGRSSNIGSYFFNNTI